MSGSLTTESQKFLNADTGGTEHRNGHWSVLQFDTLNWCGRVPAPVALQSILRGLPLSNTLDDFFEHTCITKHGEKIYARVCTFIM